MRILIAVSAFCFVPLATKGGLLDIVAIEHTLIVSGNETRHYTSGPNAGSLSTISYYNSLSSSSKTPTFSGQVEGDGIPEEHKAWQDYSVGSDVLEFSGGVSVFHVVASDYYSVEDSELYTASFFRFAFTVSDPIRYELDGVQNYYGDAVGLAWEFRLTALYDGSTIFEGGPLQWIFDDSGFASASALLSSSGVLEPGAYELVAKQESDTGGTNYEDNLWHRGVLFRAKAVPDSSSTLFLISLGFLALGQARRRFSVMS